MNTPTAPSPTPMHRWRGLFRRRDSWVLASLLAIGSISYCSFPDHHGRRGGVAELDGYYYYIYLRSLQMDGDINLANDYQRWGNPFAFDKSPTGRMRNVFGVGPAIAWSPFFVAALTSAAVGRSLGQPVPMDGLSRYHQFVTFYGSLLFGWLAVLLCYLLTRRLLGPNLALLAAVGGALAGPLPYYCLHGASYSHAAAALASSLLLWVWVHYRDQWTARRWIVFGAAAGFALLVRPATAPLLVLPVWETARAIAQARKSRQYRRPLLHALWGLLALLVVFSPQLVAWQLIFGSPLVQPQGSSFMWWSQSAWPQTLFAPRNGLFPSAPLYALALLGVFFALRAAPTRRWAGPLLLVVGLAAFVNGAAHDWWGWSFSARRFTYLLPIFTLGLCYALQGLARRMLAHPARTLTTTFAVLVLGFALFNLEWVAQFSQHNLKWYSVRDTQGLYMTVANGMAKRVYRGVGNPLSLPASAAFALRTGGSLQRYDRVEGSYLLGETNTQALPFADPHLHATVSMAGAHFRPHLSASFGAPTQDGRIRVVPLRDPKGHIFLPINRPGPLKIWLRARATRPGTVVHPAFNGAPLKPQAMAHDKWSTIFMAVPAKLVRRGINRVDLFHRLPQPSIAPRTIGGTGTTSPRDLAVASGGKQGGTFCDIWLDSRRFPCVRGINLLVMAPTSGLVLGRSSFDAHIYPAAWTQAATYLRRFPRGSIVALGIRDDVSRHFLHGGQALLAAIGAAAQLNKAKGQGFAAIGVLGADANSAIQALAKEGHARARIGRRPPSWRVIARYSAMRLR